MAGFRADFAKMGAESSSSSDEAASPRTIKRRAKEKLAAWSQTDGSQTDGANEQLEELRSRTNTSTWQTTTTRARDHAARPTQRLAAVDATAHTRYGAAAAQLRKYEGPPAPPTPPTPKREENVVPAALASSATTLDMEIHALRRDPAAYAETMVKFRAFYDVSGTFRAPRGAGRSKATEEGVAAFDEALTFLRRKKSLSDLKPVPGLASAADLVAKTSSADEAVLEWLVCDGDTTRRSRRRLLDARLTRFGTARSDDVWVATLAQTFRDFPAPGSYAYRGKVPIRDDAFLEVLLSLPEPLPSDLVDRIRRGDHVHIDYDHEAPTTVTISSPSSSSDSPPDVIRLSSPFSPPEEQHHDDEEDSDDATAAS